ncbi:MAG TPA: T9SS type A sorting domain-containing protein [Ferruginibacter sp.]|nr:T9SS type A sorting domain-containing protein [Ferruginibacter sp.]
MASTCAEPAGLTGGAITATGATVSWTAVSGALNYTVDYKLNSSFTWINAAAATTNLSVNLSGLTAGSLYDYRVRTNCNGLNSIYSQAQFTTTTASCDAPSGLTSGSVTASSATVSWTAVSGAANYDVDYKLNSSGTWTNAATGTTGLSVNLGSLTASSLYDWRVRANCTAVGLSSSYAQAQFTTAAAPTCPGPYDVSTNGTSGGAATIPFNTDIKGLISPANDNDYYRFVITTGGTATITLSTLPFDYDIRLYSSNGTSQLAISQNSGTANETITRTYTAGTYFVRVYGFNGANSATSCYTLRVQLGTATVQEPEVITSADVKVKLFPNPATDRMTLYMVGDNSRKELKLYDLSGKLIYSQPVNDMFTTFDLHKLVKGVYLVKVSGPDGKVLHSERIVKN